MRWRDAGGTNWRLRQQRLAWRRRIKPEVGADLFPSGLGDDPISAIIAIPGLVVIAVMLPFWLAEFLLRLILGPVACVLRLTRVIPYRLELSRAGEFRGAYAPKGRGELVRLRRRLLAPQPGDVMTVPEGSGPR